jgi:hypothetical protein
VSAKAVFGYCRTFSATLLFVKPGATVSVNAVEGLAQSSAKMAFPGGGGPSYSLPTAGQSSGGDWQHQMPSHAPHVPGQQSPICTQMRSQ